METFLGGLAILTIGGLVTAALKYPEGFLRIHIAVTVVIAAVVSGFIGYQLGFTAGVDVVTPYLDQAQIAKAKAVVRAAFPDERLQWAALAFAGFMVFLSYIREILGPPEDDKKQRRGKNVKPPPAKPRSRTPKA